MTELGNMLYLVSPANNSGSQEHSQSASHRSKVDKTAILKSTISYLKQQQRYDNANARPSNIQEIQEWKPSFLPSDTFMSVLLASILVICSNFAIMY